MTLIARSPVHAVTINNSYGQLGCAKAPCTNTPKNAQDVLTAIGTKYSGLFSDPISLNIDVEWGGAGLQPNSTSNSNTNAYSIKYADYVNALKNDQTTAADKIAVATLPGTAPLGNGMVDVTPANAKAVGLTPTKDAYLLGLDGTLFDGAIIFNPDTKFFFGGAAINGMQYDFTADAEHEIDEVMGILSELGYLEGADPKSKAVYPLDLFRYDNQGRSYTTDAKAKAYFSYDGGKTLLDPFNQDPSGDYGDWVGTGVCPPDTPRVQSAALCPGKIIPLDTETKELDVIGYDVTPEPGTFLLFCCGITVLTFAGCKRLGA